MSDVPPIIHQPTLMIYGEQGTVPKSGNLKNIVPNLDIVSLDCGHWIQQEKPEETPQAILKWLEKPEYLIRNRKTFSRIRENKNPVGSGIFCFNLHLFDLYRH